ncbi:MAG: hypothetical protein NTV63_01620 [Candidatus Woesearchaeota archaeon]|nr:hypothetical protein [Candidatus Woesearchaeota archaeon]
MPENSIERLLNEAREGERLVKEFKPEFALESLVKYNFHAFKHYGHDMGFTNPESVANDRINLIRYGMEELSYDAQRFDSALNAYLSLNSRICSTAGKDENEFSSLESAISDFRLSYGGTLKMKTEVDIRNAYQRILDMRDSAETYLRNGKIQNKKKAESALDFLNKVAEENNYLLSYGIRKYRGNLSSEAIARDVFRGKMPEKDFTFEESEPLKIKQPEAMEEEQQIPAPAYEPVYCEPSPSQPKEKSTNQIFYEQETARSLRRSGVPSYVIRKCISGEKSPNEALYEAENMRAENPIKYALMRLF